MTMVPSKHNRPEHGRREHGNEVDASTVGDVSNRLFEEHPAQTPDTAHEVLAPNLSDSEDVSLVERARTQWELGEWRRLIDLVQGSIESHPERAKLASLAAVAYS